MLAAMKSRSRSGERRHQRALTLVELLVAIAIACVLVALAAPGFHNFILMQRLKGTHAQLVTDLQYARSEAISRGMVVNVRVQPAIGANPSCYIVFTDANRNYSQLGASTSCNCWPAEGSRCTVVGTAEIRTVQVPASLGVGFSLPLGQTGAVGFDPVTGGMVLVLSELGVGTGNDFTVFTSIDAAHRLAAVVGLSGRPTVCRPTGSTMVERDC